MSVRTALWVSAVLTPIAVGIPQSVAIGVYLLVVAGLILALAPTAFLYTATFAIVRRFLPITHAFAHDLIAACAAIVRVGRPIEDAPFPPRYTAEEFARERFTIMGYVKHARDPTEYECAYT